MTSPSPRAALIAELPEDPSSSPDEHTGRPRHVILYTSNGEARQEFSIVLTARPLAGRPTPSSESSEVRWVPAAEIHGYTMGRPMRTRINDFLARDDLPLII